MTAGWRSEARQRLDAAQTEGWFVEFADGAIWTDRGYVGSVLADHRDFIARAPNDIRRALDALDAVLAAVGDEMAVVGGDYDAGWSEGWNACREAAVRAIEGDA